MQIHPVLNASAPASPTSQSLPSGSRFYLGLACSVATLGGLLFGYDTAVISGAIGFLQSHFSLTSVGGGWAAASALLGCMIGAALGGWLSDRLGRKTVLVFCAVLFLLSAIGTALAQTLSQFVAFRVLGGIGVGAASMTSPLYIAEISPARIRGRLVSLNQFAIIFGMLAIYFVNFFIARAGDETWNVQYGWRWMFGSGAVPATMLLVLLFFVPESPRWLSENARDGEAWAILLRIHGSQGARRELEAIQETRAHESGSLGQLLTGGMRTALLVGAGLAVLQQVTGINVFLYYAPEIFKAIAKSGTSAALMQTVVVGAVNLTFTIVAVWTVDRVGRRPLMMGGFSAMGVSLVGLGLAAWFGRTEVWLLLFILVYIAGFALSVGPVTWVILSEIFPTRIRGRAMAIATVLLWGANFVISQTFPMMDQNRWLIEHFHHALPFWLYGSLCLVAIIFVAILVPETKGRSLEYTEQLWSKEQSGINERVAP